MRIYNRGFRSENAAGGPIPGAHVTLWDAQTGGTQLVSGIETLDGIPIPGAVLICDSWGYAPSFRDPLDRPDLWAIGADSGTITGVDRVHLEPDDTDDRVTALETFTSGPGGLDSRLSGLEDSRGMPSGLATLGADGKVPTGQLPIGTGNSATYSVTDYGATGNGTTDDAAAIQAALDQASLTNPGSTLYIPAGTYLVASELEIKGPVWINAAPGATIRRGSSAMQYMIRNFNSSYAPTLYNGRGGIRITGGVWDADGGNLTGSVTAIIVAHAKGVRVEGVTVRGVRDWHAVELNSTQDAVVRNCNFEGFNPFTAGRYISEAVQVDLALNSAALPGLGAGGYDSTPCDDILIEGCSVRAFGSLNSFGCLTGSHSWADGHKHKNIRVIGNFADSLSDFMVNAQNWDNVVVSGNIATNCNALAAFQVPSGMTDDVRGCVISNNRVQASGTQNQNTAVNPACIYIQGQDAGTAGSVCHEVAITGNVLGTVSNPNAGISVFSAANAVVSGNTMENLNGTSTVGILINGSAKATVVGNKMSTVKNRGIILSSPTAGGQVADYANVTGNTVAFVNTAAGAGIGAIDVNAKYVNVAGNQIVCNNDTYGVAFWGPAVGGCCTGNNINNSAAGTGSAGVRNASASVLTLTGNFINGWTAYTASPGAAGQNVWLSNGTVLPTDATTSNYVNHAKV